MEKVTKADVTLRARSADSGKEKGPEIIRAFRCWWRWRESNPRPKAINARYYMLSSPFDLVFRQYGVLNAPVDQSGSFRRAPSDRGFGLSHDSDGTSTSMSTSGFPAYALSGESVVVVVGN